MVSPLSDDDIEFIESFLFSDELSDDTMDFLEVHGLLTAVVVSPKPLNEQRWLACVFGERPPPADHPDFDTVMAKLRQLEAYTRQTLTLGDSYDLPFESMEDDEGAAARNWCVGFMEGVFLEEAAWFADDEEYVAELLLPFMVLSDLYDEADFGELRQDESLMASFCHQLPELLVDLYLNFHSP